MNPALFDPDDWRTEDLPAVLRPLHRLYLYIACRVTGHATHALNALLIWALVGGPLWFPLAWYWVLPVIFYSLRELPDLFRGRGDWLDHLGDVAWVYAVGMALWLPPKALVPWIILTMTIQVTFWCGPAPSWMPRSSLLWGRARSGPSG